ncbi:phenylalanine--tRNA ligase, mitochondrial [Frankliniella occidentalis]|uniref:Phenylalanine--tRNA ligase, mitochondrial n=1 Tax=Frankliniella occidentalis TaxID=133901 RepID=A0A6J1SRH6_FRAOC|nr:phenylalanine--tRNA ligase, mitochondrial [Frankliniella occidentalis]
MILNFRRLREDSAAEFVLLKRQNNRCCKMKNLLIRPIGVAHNICSAHIAVKPLTCSMSSFANSDASQTSSAPALAPQASPLATLTVSGKQFERDSYTNITDGIIKHMSRKLHQQKGHPLYLIKECIKSYFYKKYIGRTGNPVFSVYDNQDPIVTTYQNFDSLLVPRNHVSRQKSDSYYLNSQYMLRAHTTAHQSDLISSGLDNFLIIGDVYRRDTVDSTHYPVFHQCDAVRLQTQHELFPEEYGLHVFEKRPDRRTDDKQAEHTVDAVRILSFQLKSTLQDLAKALFGADVEYRWVEAYFPFTHPSWELEIKHNGEWLELLGCGIMEHTIVKKAGAGDRIGWAFGLGLERVAMRVYDIPDIRLFWSTDSAFLNQFAVDDPFTPIKYKAVSVYPRCINDISFWIPPERDFSQNDFFDVVRSVGGDIIEEVSLVDQFVHPKKKLTSHCYRITYRHMERTLTKNEVNEVHVEIGRRATEMLGITVRVK